MHQAELQSEVVVHRATDLRTDFVFSFFGPDGIFFKKMQK